MSYLETVPPLLLIKRAHSAFNAFPITQIHTYTHTSHTAGSNTGFPHNRIPKLHEAHTTFPYYSHCSMAIGGRKNTQVWNPAKRTRQEHPPTHISILIRFDHHPLSAKKALRLSLLSLSLSLSVCEPHRLIKQKPDIRRQTNNETQSTHFANTKLNRLHT